MRRGRRCSGRPPRNRPRGRRSSGRWPCRSRRGSSRSATAGRRPRRARRPASRPGHRPCRRAVAAPERHAVAGHPGDVRGECVLRRRERVDADPVDEVRADDALDAGGRLRRQVVGPRGAADPGVGADRREQLRLRRREPRAARRPRRHHQKHRPAMPRRWIPGPASRLPRRRSMVHPRRRVAAARTRHSRRGSRSQARRPRRPQPAPSSGA